MATNPIHPNVRIGHVHLKVADLQRSLKFYRDVLGFEVTQGYGEDAAFISAGGYHHHIGLNTWESKGGLPPAPGATGLYHVAILYPTRAALADALRRLMKAHIRLTGASDHGVSEALYLNDPDGNGVELYWDRPQEQWPRNPDGSLAMYTRQLDLDDLLAQHEGDTRTMKRSLLTGFAVLLAVTLPCAVTGCATTAGHDKGSLTMLSVSSMPRTGTIDERYQSYNVEMLEVTGGKFWKPYADTSGSSKVTQQKQGQSASGAIPAGMNPDAYAYRPPIDLANARRRKLAAALGPAYVRVSGTWANTSYFADSDQPPTTPPAGFSGVLSRDQWKGVVDFANAVNAQIVTSFATSPGARDSAGVWTPDLAKRFLSYTKSVGGNIAAAEFMNEPTMALMGGAPAGYDAAAYGRDYKVFHAFIKQAAPDVVVLGPGSVGETDGDWGVTYGMAGMIKTSDMLAACGPTGVDAFSYHHYGASSQRCAGTGMGGTTAAAALSEEWLARTDQTLSFYRRLRDQYDPGKPMWVTETADAACGGNPWASTFLDAFRYLDQLGRLAKQGVQVVMHNTLDASDYSLLDENTFEPRPNYWAALLWRKFMGTTVLDSGMPIQSGLHVYAHSLRGVRGGVTLLIINTDKTAARTLAIPITGMRYTLSATSLQNHRVQLNGNELMLGPDDALPDLEGVPVAAGDITFGPATITFLTLKDAGNTACK